LRPLLAVGWTLNYEAFFYVCFALALLFVRGKAALSILFVALAVLWFFIPPGLFVAYFYADPTILEFLIGILFEQFYYRGLRLPLWGSLLSLGLATISYIGISAIEALADIRVVGLGIPALFFAAAFIFAPEPKRGGAVVRALRLGGDASYTLYLSHPFVANAMLIGLAWLGLADPTLGCLLTIGVAVVVAIVFYVFAERPVTQALHRYFGFGRQSEAQMVAP
jgi:peptidoglycan/LPS O-acetylase OafA/YrhL